MLRHLFSAHCSPTASIRLVDIDIGAATIQQLDSGRTQEIIDCAIESGILYPPILVVENGDRYLLIAGINHLEAAKKLYWSQDSRFSDRIEAHVCESMAEAEACLRQLRNFG